MRYLSDNPPLLLFTLISIPLTMPLFIILGKLSDKAIAKMKEVKSFYHEWPNIQPVPRYAAGGLPTDLHPFHCMTYLCGRGLLLSLGPFLYIQDTDFQANLFRFHDMHRMSLWHRKIEDMVNVHQLEDVCIRDNTSFHDAQHHHIQDKKAYSLNFF